MLLFLLLFTLNQPIYPSIVEAAESPSIVLSVPFPFTPPEKEVVDGLSHAIALCQRNSQRY